MKRAFKSIVMVATIGAMMSSTACFATEVEMSRNQEIVPVYATMTKTGIEEIDGADTISTITENGRTYFSITDIATITGQSDPSTWDETTSAHYMTVRQHQIVPADCTRITSNGSAYELGENFLAKDVDDSLVSVTGTVGSRIENGEVYATADCVNFLFNNTVAHEDAIYILDNARELDMISKVSDEYINTVSTALLNLWVKDREGYDYVLTHCKTVKMSTMSVANRVCNGTGVLAFVRWADRPTMNLTKELMENSSIDFISHTMVHEANHCDKSSGQNENTSVPTEIACMIRMGLDQETIQNRIDEFFNANSYSTGAKAAQKLFDEHFNH